MIPFIRPFYDDDDFNAVKEVLQSGWVAQGPKVEEFEEAASLRDKIKFLEKKIKDNK